MYTGMIWLDLFLGLVAIVTFFGMIAEKDSRDIRQGCTYGFLVSLGGLIIINALIILAGR